MAETQNTELNLIQKQLKKKDMLLKSQKTHKRGKRVRLEGKFLYSSQKVLEIAQEAETKKVVKQPRRWPHKQPIEEIEEEEEENTLEDSISVSEVELEECVAYRTRSKRVGSDLVSH